MPTRLSASRGLAGLGDLDGDVCGLDGGDREHSRLWPDFHAVVAQHLVQGITGLMRIRRLRALGCRTRSVALLMMLTLWLSAWPVVTGLADLAACPVAYRVAPA